MNTETEVHDISVRAIERYRQDLLDELGYERVSRMIAARVGGKEIVAKNVPGGHDLDLGLTLQDAANFITALVGSIAVLKQIIGKVKAPKEEPFEREGTIIKLARRKLMKEGGGSQILLEEEILEFSMKLVLRSENE